ncbi:glycosyltransferase family 2 protein [Rheinheimera sp. MM224]|uniref:glycosyltransferase family 2 protein n=1 Tax=Rheinheimera sp. MM224 TaxID=3019969 RepID=UPI0021F8ECA8|nr:glycosyltransferase family 2 protein [Rheinheimera sp. MM224]CAI3796505.1 hypothetical protein JAMGFMIE_01584 [Rheinheimera sp. MM224]
MQLVTVVIPFYSTVRGLLINSVRSALNQTLSDIEIIVVDDCSPVPAQDELKSIDDSRLKIVRHNINSNGGIARNSGLDSASGDYVAFLDYDDIWYPDKLEKQLALFKQAEKMSENPVVYSRCKIIDGNRTMIRPVRAIADKEPVGDYLFCARQIIQTSGIFLRTAVAKSVRFDDLKRHQDYQFCLSLEQYGCTFHMLETPSYDFIQIPKLNDYNFSLQWLMTYSKFLSGKAKHSFLALVVVRSMIRHKHFISAVMLSLRHGIFLSFLYSLFAFISKAILFKR